MQALTLEQGQAMVNHAADQIAVQEVIETLITRLQTAVPGEMFANGSVEFHQDALATLKALMVRHCGERV